MVWLIFFFFFFFSSRRRHTRFDCDWSSDVCSSDLELPRSGGLVTRSAEARLPLRRPDDLRIVHGGDGPARSPRTWVLSAATLIPRSAAARAAIRVAATYQVRTSPCPRGLSSHATHLDFAYVGGHRPVELVWKGGTH